MREVRLVSPSGNLSAGTANGSALLPHTCNSASTRILFCVHALIVTYTDDKYHINLVDRFQKKVWGYHDLEAPDGMHEPVVLVS